jgi:hypothetical protein
MKTAVVVSGYMEEDTTVDNLPSFDAASLSYGNEVNQLTLCVRDGVAHFTLVGDPEGRSLYACIRFAVASGIMQLPMPVLVDMTRFSGSIDWQGIHAVAEMTFSQLRAGQPSRVAYVAPYGWVSLLIKLASHIFPKSQHRLFPSREQALEWLQSNAASPEAP